MTDYSIIYGGLDENIKSPDLINYSDSNFEACRIIRCSIDGYIFMLNSRLISWSSKHQSIVALSMIKAEYYALSQTIKEVI